MGRDFSSMEQFTMEDTDRLGLFWEGLGFNCNYQSGIGNIETHIYTRLEHAYETDSPVD